jgi:hypothetical protein
MREGFSRSIASASSKREVLIAVRRSSFAPAAASADSTAGSARSWEAVVSAVAPAASVAFGSAPSSSKSCTIRSRFFAAA